MKPPSLWQRVRIALWPRVSWGRSARYYAKRVVRLSGSPHAIALGVGVGAGVSFTPFLGFHIFLALAVAFLSAPISSRRRSAPRSAIR